MKVEVTMRGNRNARKNINPGSRRLTAASAAMFLALSLMGCGSPDPAEPAVSPPQPEAEYRKLTPREAEAMMSDDVVILDVRTQDEYDGGHIRNAILLPVDEIGLKAEDTLPDKDQMIFVYCRSGVRSQSAANALIGLGYTDVYDIGGIRDWTGEIVIDK